MWDGIRKRNYQKQRIKEIIGNKWIIWLIGIGKISVVNSADYWRLKAPLAGSTRTIFGFLRLNAGFGHVLFSCWDRMGQLCSLNCSGISPWQVHPGTACLYRWQIRPGFATLLPASPISQGWDLGGSCTQCGVLRAESVPGRLVGLGTRFSSLQAQLTSPA